MPKNERLATLAIITGNSIFGFSFMFSRIALESAQPFVMLMYRFIAAFVLIHLLAMWSRRSKRQGWLRFQVRARECGPLVVLGLVQPVVYFLCESYGITLTNATFSGVIIALVPIAALILGAVFLREIPRPRQVGFALLSIAGVVMMTLQQSAQGAVQPLGVVLLLGAVLSGTSFNLISRKTSVRFSALERTYVMMLVGALSFSALALFECRSTPALLLAPLARPSFLLSIGYLSVLSSIAAFLVINYAHDVLSVARTSIFANLTTVLSVAAGVIFLGESFGWLSLISSAVILIGIWGVQRA